MSEATEPVAGLEARYAALRQAARSEGGDPGDVLEAAFTELEGAIDLLRAVAPCSSRRFLRHTVGRRARPAARGVPGRAPAAVPGRPRRHGPAGQPGGRRDDWGQARLRDRPPVLAFVALASRAAVNSQLTAVGRTGKPRRSGAAWSPGTAWSRVSSSSAGSA
jgi:hypothetical protein